ncbi:MAG: hypothetical protein IJ192_02930 [Clostridia bacterium]|nr:hypothetical protein [Clostridia bacterium]
MPSLNHVCMWVENQWKPIEVHEIISSHQSGGVSGYSGLFMCSLCGQYVTFANGDVYTPYFKHRKEELSKNCPERTFGLGYTIRYDTKKHDLPLKIHINRGELSFEIGLIKVPSEYLNRNSYIDIQSDNKTETFRYNIDRLSPNDVTYLSVGKNLSSQYIIKVHNASKGIELYWPSIVGGVDLEGTVFDANTGKKLPNDADVVINKTYYLLTHKNIYRSPSNVDIRKIFDTNKNGQYIRVYRVEASAYSKESACFFLDYHCRLTEHPVKLQPIWPVYANSPYLIKHNRKEMYIHIAGEAGLHLFPTAYSHVISCSNGKIARITVNNKQQFISVGRMQVLRYKYFWQEPIQKPLSKQIVNVVDKQNNTVVSGVVNCLPKDRIIRCALPYDGTVVIQEKSITKEKRSVKAGEQTTINNINWGTSITVFIGFDCVWEVSFEKIISESQDEKKLLYKLRACSGNMVDIPHSIGSLVHRFKSYPKIRQWIYQCIRQGKMPEKALKMIKSYVVNEKVV